LKFIVAPSSTTLDDKPHPTGLIDTLYQHLVCRNRLVSRIITASLEAVKKL
jgi:hypothetical protein